MKHPLFYRTAAIFLLLAGIAASASAQGNGSAAKPARTLPFAAGEKLTYEGKLSKIIRGIAVADLVLTVKDADSDGRMLIEAVATSKGTLLKLFRFSFLQRVSSTVDRNGIFALRTVKHDVQKERVRDSEAEFDYDQRRVTYTEVDPKDRMRPPRRIASELSGATHDIISGIYALRTMPLAIGKTIEMSVSDSGLVYSIPVKVTAREQQKTMLGRVWCYRVEPQIFGKGRFIEQEGSMVIWITDDPRRIPIRSVVRSSVGKLDIRLRAAEGVK